MLRDHFHPPLRDERDWHSFHAAWATYIAEDLTPRLPEYFYVQPQAKFGIEIDMAVYEERERSSGGMVREAIAMTPWTAPPPALTAPLPIITDAVEVLIYYNEGGPVLVGAIELVSPANKDRPEHREAFIAKCAALLHQGIGLMIVDIVTSRKASLHLELLDRLRVIDGVEMSSSLYAASYHPVERHGSTGLDIWQEPLAIGSALVTMPLFLRGGPGLPVDLAKSYERTCNIQRIAGEAVAVSQ